MATRFCQLSPPLGQKSLPPPLPNMEVLSLRFIKRDDGLPYMILIKKKHYNADTRVPKSLDDSHMSGSKVNSPWFKVTLFLLPLRSVS